MKNKLTKILTGAAIATAAISPVAALASCNHKPKTKFDVYVEGATFDEENSDIKLNEESKIVLKNKQGYKVALITSLAVGGKELTTSDYSFAATTNTITIKAAAMTSTTIQITVWNDTVEAIAWNTGWYAYQLDKSQAGVTKTKEVETVFELKTALPADETLYYAINVKDTSTKERVLKVTEGKYDFGASSSRLVVTIPQYLKSTGGDIMNIGDHIDYDITFISVKNENIVWSHTIEDLNLYLFSKYSYTTFLDTENTGYKAKAEFKSTINMKPKLFGTVVMGQAVISNVRRSSGVPKDVTVVLEDGVKATSEQHLQQTIKFSKTDGLTTGDNITFDLTLYLWLAELPNQKVPFKGENLVLKYTKK